VVEALWHGRVLFVDFGRSIAVGGYRPELVERGELVNVNRLGFGFAAREVAGMRTKWARSDGRSHSGSPRLNFRLGRHIQRDVVRIRRDCARAKARGR
jgi:hypothetical protein